MPFTSQGVLDYLGKRGYEGVVMWSGGCIDWFFHDFTRELPVYINGMADAGVGHQAKES